MSVMAEAKRTVPRPAMRLVGRDELEMLEPLLREFNREAKLLPDPDSGQHFFENTAALIDNGTGVVIGMFDGERIIGAIAGVCFPCLFTGGMVATELFWFVTAEKRRYGMLMMAAFEEWARRRDCTRVAMVALEAIKGGSLGRLYEKKGYVKTETTYFKWL